MSERPDHELRVLEVDQTVPPRPEEDVADADAGSGGTDVDRDGEPTETA